MQVRIFLQDFIGPLPLSHARKRIIAQTDRHAAFAGFPRKPLHQFPPRLGKERRIAGVGQPVGIPPLIAVGVIDLQAHHSLARQLVQLPGEPFPGQRVADPPVKGHFAIPRRWGEEARQNIEVGRPAGVADCVVGRGCQPQRMVRLVGSLKSRTSSG